MCGIVGYVGRQDAAPILLAGLHRLEYRGYDSAGVAVVARSGLKVHKAVGKIAQLEAALPKRLRGTVGIGHTRWATHGEPARGAHAHPHVDCTGNIAVAHSRIHRERLHAAPRLEAEGRTSSARTPTPSCWRISSRPRAATSPRRCEPPSPRSTGPTASPSWMHAIPIDSWWRATAAPW